MNCKEVTEILSLYVDGFGSEEQTTLAEEHLANCPSCRERVEEWRHAAELLAGLEPVRAPEGFAEGVMEAVLKQPFPAAPESAFVAWPARPASVPWTWTAAAVLMMSVGLVLWLGPEGSAAAHLARGVLKFLSSLLGR